MTVALRRIADGTVCLAFLIGAAFPAAGQTPAFPQGQSATNPQAAGPQQGPVPAGANPAYGPQPANVQQGGAPQGPVPQTGAVATPPARVPVAPFQLTPPQEEYLNQVLNYWEFKSRQVERFRCKFTRWEYDPVFGPRDPYTAKTESTGVIMYSAPDKGLFRVDKTFHYTAPANPGEQPRYVEREGEVGEHWVCDGQSVFEYNHQQKKLIQHELPPEMRGRAIANSPLPFIFGANASQIKERFWMRVITPRDAKGEYWLEAYPRHQADAANYQKIEIILDETDYLPKAIQIYDPTYDARRNPKRTAFVFEQREVNWNITLQKLNLFHKEFYEPTLPSGWKKEVQRYNQGAPGGQGPTARTVSATTESR